MAEREPVKTLAEQPPRMGRRAVIVAGERPPSLAFGSDMAKIATLRLVTGESLPLQRGFSSGGLDRDLAVAAVGKPVGPDAPAGKIVRGELIDRQQVAKLRRQRVGGVVILMRPLESRHPQSFGAMFHDRPADFGSRGIQMMA
jgi:hypothetical protein